MSGGNSRNTTQKVKEWDKARLTKLNQETRDKERGFQDLLRRKKIKEPPQKPAPPIWDTSPSIIASRAVRYHFLRKRWRRRSWDQERIRKQRDLPKPGQKEPADSKSAFQRGKEFDNKKRTETSSRAAIKAMIAAEKKLDDIYNKLGEKKTKKTKKTESNKTPAVENDLPQAIALVENSKTSPYINQIEQKLTQTENFPKWSRSINTKINNNINNNTTAVTKTKISFRNTPKPTAKKTLTTRYRAPPPLPPPPTF